jgi:hypothetical protein
LGNARVDLHHERRVSRVFNGRLVLSLCTGHCSGSMCTLACDYTHRQRSTPRRAHQYRDR